MNGVREAERIYDRRAPDDRDALYDAADDLDDADDDEDSEGGNVVRSVKFIEIPKAEPRVNGEDKTSAT